MITLLCGRVAAGKSHLARRMEAEGALILSCDEMMLTLYDHCLGPERHDEAALRCLHFLFSVAARASAQGVDTVVDYGLWLRSERDAARDYFRGRGIPYRILVVETPQELRFQRLAQRNETLRNAAERVYLIEGALLERMDAKWQPPGPEETDLTYFENLEDSVL